MTIKQKRHSYACSGPDPLADVSELYRFRSMRERNWFTYKYSRSFANAPIKRITRNEFDRLRAYFISRDGMGDTSGHADVKGFIDIEERGDNFIQKKYGLPESIFEPLKINKI